MSKLSPILAPEADRAHYVAQITLSALAALMVAALTWAGWKGAFPGLMKSFKGQPLAVQPESKKGVSAALPATVMPVDPLPMPPPRTPAPIAVLPSEPLPRIGATAVPDVPVPSLPRPPAPPPSLTGSNDPTSPLVPSGKPISDPQAREMVKQARDIRGLGDMQGALELFRAADLREQNHPEILSEIALTYEAMGLRDKAENAWRVVLGMGEEAAGSYYPLARSKLEGLQDAAKTVAASTEVNPLSLGRCTVIPDKTVTKGQRLILRIPLIAAPNAVIDSEKVDVHVYFYDKLPDGSVAPTHADQPTSAWVNSPVDWKVTPEELLDVTYNMPELKPEELRNLGRRTYDGYVVKLYYQDKFMGEQAEPKSLLDYRPSQVGAGGMNNSLFPKN